MSKTKYFESNILIAQTQGLPRFIQEKTVVSSKDEELAKQYILNLINGIQNFFKCIGQGSKLEHGNRSAPIWIPYEIILGEALSSERGTDNRATRRLFAFIKIITLTKVELRHKLIHDGCEKEEQCVISSLKDLAEALYITQNIAGVPAYKHEFYKDIFLLLLRSKKNKDRSSDGKEETIIGVTTKQLSDFYKQQTGKAMSPENIRKNFLEELENHNYIGSVKSVIDARQNIYYALIEFDDNIPQHQENDNDKMQKLQNSKQFHNFLQHAYIILPKNCKDIPKNWLIFEILGIMKYGTNLSKFRGCIADYLNQNEELKLVDKDGNRLTIKQFITEYETVL